MFYFLIVLFSSYLMFSLAVNLRTKDETNFLLKGFEQYVVKRGSLFIINFFHFLIYSILEKKK